LGAWARHAFIPFRVPDLVSPPLPNKDFREILLIASKGQGVNNVQKRYSLAVGPPRKTQKFKGIQSAATQAFLRRKEEELRRKALEEKRRKEELVKKRSAQTRQESKSFGQED
jgi:protein SPT2